MTRSIHQGLVGPRSLVGTRYLADPKLRKSYSEEIAPRTEIALDQVLSRITLPLPQRVLDLGAGTGAAGQTVRKHHPGIDLVSLDQIPGDGIGVADLSRSIRPKTVVGTFDWIVAAHLLNELAKSQGPDTLARLVHFWMDEYLTSDGVLILVEPALRVTSRGLLEVRDRLLLLGVFVWAPCLMQHPCPALLRERDFCHDSGAVLRSHRSRVDFSYLVLGKKPPPEKNSSVWRVVSDPMKEKGRLRLFACGVDGRVLITRLHRDRSEENRVLDAVRRGEAIRILGASGTADGIRVGDTTKVHRDGEF